MQHSNMNIMSVHPSYVCLSGMCYTS